MVAICINNSHTWRNVLTIEKEYDVLSMHDDKYTGDKMISISCDDGMTRVYSENRFVFDKVNGK